MPGDEEDIAGRPLHVGVMLYEEERDKDGEKEKEAGMKRMMLHVCATCIRTHT